MNSLSTELHGSYGQRRAIRAGDNSKGPSWLQCAKLHVLWGLSFPTCVTGVLTWLLVPQLPLQVALVELLQVPGEPLFVGQTGRAHRADRLYPIGAAATTMVT